LEFDRLLRENLENRVLDFDSAAAAETASLAAARRKSGRPWTCVTAKLPALRWRATPAFPRQHPYDILRERKPVSPAIAVRLGKLLAVALVGSHAGRLRYMECRAQRGCQRMAPHFERLARMPWPIASLASSGISAFSSALDLSCSKGLPSAAEETGKFSPRIRNAHINNSNNLDP